MPAFLPAAQLCRAFYLDVLAPQLGDVPHAAGLLGAGSEVLGYDTERSTDHDWAPGATLLVRPDDVAPVRDLVGRLLPPTYRGWPRDARRDDVQPHHRVVVDDVRSWALGQLGVDPLDGLGPLDWLVLPQQLLLQVTAGPVFHDGVGALTRVRAELAWYPDDVWWWLMACQWHRIAQEEPFVQRTDEVDDVTGSAVLVARLVRDVMRATLLLGRRYAPYGKWLGTAFARLGHHDRLDVHLAAAVRAGDLAARETALSAAYEALARRHARLPGAGSPDPVVRPFFDRPAAVLDADRFTRDCLRRVGDPALLGLPLIGGVDQVCDSTDLLAAPHLARRARALYLH